MAQNTLPGKIRIEARLAVVRAQRGEQYASALLDATQAQVSLFALGEEERSAREALLLAEVSKNVVRLATLAGVDLDDVRELGKLYLTADLSDERYEALRREEGEDGC